MGLHCKLLFKNNGVELHWLLLSCASRWSAGATPGLRERVGFLMGFNDIPNHPNRIMNRTSILPILAIAVIIALHGLNSRAGTVVYDLKTDWSDGSNMSGRCDIHIEV